MRKIVSIILMAAMLFHIPVIAATAETYDYAKEMEFARMLKLFPDTEYESREAEQPVMRNVYSEVMKNIWGESFSPYYETKGMITAGEAAEQMVILLGYKRMPAYNGWQNTANKLHLLKNVNINSINEMTYGEFAAILYNARKIPLYEISKWEADSAYYVESEETFLSGILKCREVKGVLTDNGYTALDGDSLIGDDKIKIDNESFLLSEEQYNIREWIGRKVSGYVTNEDKEDIQTVVALKLEEYDRYAEFSMEDFVDFSGTQLLYEERGRVKSVNISEVPFVIFNGKFERSLKESFFDYECGSVYVGSIGGTKYDIVIIEGYISWYISHIDDVNMCIYPSDTDSSLFDGTRVLNVDPNKKTQMRLFNKSGDIASLQDFYKNTVIDICENGDYLKVMAADRNVFDARITEIDDDFYHTKDASYRISKKYTKSKNSVQPEVGGYYNLYVNNFGFVVKIEKSSSDLERVGVFIKAETVDGSLDDPGRMRIFTQNGSVEIFEVKDKIKFVDKNNNSQKYTYKQLYAALENYSENILSYKLNAEGKISEIALPADPGMERKQGRLGYILKNERGYYEAGKGNIEGKAIVNDSLTKVFTINLSVSDKNKRYSISSISSLGTSSGPWDAFNTEPESPYIEYILYARQSIVTDLTGYQWFFITDTYIGIDDSEEERNILDGYTLGGEKYPVKTTYYCDDDIMSNVTDIAKSGKLYSVEEGDIIIVRCTLDVIDEMFVLYKSDLEKEGRNGMLAGHLGYHDPAYPGISNPFVLGSSSNALSEGAYTLPWRTIFGYVQHLDSRGNMTITTQDLTAGDYDPNNTDPRYVTEYVSPSSFMTELKIEHGRRGKDVTVRTISSSEVRPYDVVGSSCSKIIVYTWYGKYSRMIIINEDE
ncbi:MAG: hypothetical protein J6N52_14185 [Clostridia bacterium]|nr:hypothetical protein [Clostridia bacterium]